MPCGECQDDDSDGLTGQIRDSAAQPAKMSGDAGNVEQHPLSEQIAADRYLKEQRAAKAPHRGLRITRLIPPGAA